MSAPDVEVAMMRWWREQSSRLVDHLRKGYRVGSLDKKAMSALTQCTGEAFRAGWAAAEAMLASRGEQPSLFELQPSEEKKREP